MTLPRPAAHRAFRIAAPAAFVRLPRVGTLVLMAALAACHPASKDGADIPGDRHDTRPFEGVAADETLHVTGTEPFWSGEIRGATMVWKTPERPDGQSVPLSRFNGRGGFSYSGSIDGVGFTMAVTPGKCSDGMSDRTYPFVVTLQLGEAELRQGCGWSDKQQAAEPGAP